MSFIPAPQTCNVLIEVKAICQRYQGFQGIACSIFTRSLVMASCYAELQQQT